MKLKSYPNTKRGILSHRSSIFDPLGSLVPFLLEPKHVIQQLWKEKIEWDGKIPETLNNRWITWKQLWEQQDLVKIPRWYGFHYNNVNSVELHAFADASSLVYGAAAYFRLVSINNVTTMFAFAKSRLVPLKERLLTIPKLELKAAVIAARMKHTVFHEISFHPRAIFLWTDSKTVIRYIQNEKGHLPIFVMHRINEIKQVSEISDWHCIPREQNLADLCTRTQIDFKLIQQK